MLLVWVHQESSNARRNNYPTYANSDYTQVGLYDGRILGGKSTLHLQCNIRKTFSKDVTDSGLHLSLDGKVSNLPMN